MTPRIGPLAYLTPILVGGVAALIGLVPVGLRFADWPAPNLLFVVLALWCARREEALPRVTVFLLVLTYEALRAGPIGLETLILLAATEALRVAAENRARRAFWLEWLLFAAAALAVELCIWAALTVTFAPSPTLSDMALRALAAILA
ncbi:MAG: hypothetical protein KTR21_15680 [Rhodobacteraceae bacterium]|nr:hypothetical protein [Paracoccaceae bacterium]